MNKQAKNYISAVNQNTALSYIRFYRKMKYPMLSKGVKHCRAICISYRSYRRIPLGLYLEISSITYIANTLVLTLQYVQTEMGLVTALVLSRTECRELQRDFN